MMIEHPATVQHISRNWLSAVLRDRGFLGAERILGFTNEPFDPAAGQLSAITRVHLEYDRPTRLPPSLVLKFHAPTEAAHQLGIRLRAYEREHLFFSEIAASAPLPVPACHASVVDEEKQRFILLLEDLGGMHFADQIEGATYDQAARVVSALARLHAATWGGTDVARLEWMPPINGEVNQSLSAGFRDCWPGFWQRYGASLPAAARQIGEQSCRRFPELLDRQAEIADDLGKMCVCHGDCRLDNMAFDTDGQRVYLFDWQLPFKNLGPIDVSYFLGGSLPVEVRRSRERELVRLYHHELHALGVDDLSFAACWDLYRLGHLYYLAYIVIGGVQTEVENEKSFRLFQVAGRRHFTSCLDHGSLGLVERSYLIGGRASATPSS